jgi:SAM-dependent methyltransferase
MARKIKKRYYKLILKKINFWIKNRKLTIFFVNRYKDTLVESLIKTYCLGRGIEVGVGKTPYCNRENTIYVDKHKNSRIPLDIICDASHLTCPSDSFDFLLASHCLEHCPDTLKVLNEWMRVLKPGGTLFLILPHADRVIPDKDRMKTTLAHHIEEYKNKVREDDQSHWEEIKKASLKYKDKLNENAVWVAAGEPWDFSHLAKTSHLHYHVWTQNEMLEILKYLKLKILYVSEDVPERHDSFLIIAKN